MCNSDSCDNRGHDRARGTIFKVLGNNCAMAAGRRPRAALGALALLGCLLIALCLLPATASAYTIQQNQDQVTGAFVISPTEVELDVNPGDTISRDVVLVNRTGDPITINFSVEDFQGSEDPSQDTVFMGANDSKWGARHWLTPEIPSVTLKQGEMLTMPVKVDVPKDAEPGGHYAVLFASSTAKNTSNGSSVNITSRVGSLFLIRVSGPMTMLGTLNDPEVPSLGEYGPIDIGLVFNNQGNVHLKPSGQIHIKNMLGQTVADVPVREWVVLPESSRRLISSWDARYLFGRYTAEAEIFYGDGTRLIASSTFWVIPWKIIVAILAALVLLVFAASRLTRDRRRLRRARRAGGGIGDPGQFKPLPSPGIGEMQMALAADGGAVTMPAAMDATEAERQQTYMALNELFPSMGDNRVIDIGDDDTKKLLRNMIASQLDMARAFLAEGKHDEARSELEEARYAAQRLGMLSEIGIIDDMLQWV